MCNEYMCITVVCVCVHVCVMVVWWLGGWDAGLHRLNPSFLLFIFETLLLSSQTDLELTLWLRLALNF